MAKYKVLERSFIGNRIVEPGEVVEHTFYPHNDPTQPHGSHGSNLHPHEEGEVARRGRKKAAATDSTTGTDPAATDDLS